MTNVVVVSGGFDPLHSGHIALLEQAKSIAGNNGLLVVGLNSDEWLTAKKGKPFLSMNERAIILSAIKYVDLVVMFDDADGSAINLLKYIRTFYPNENIIFANGGDRTSNNIPEIRTASEHNISLMFGVGGDYKKNSSSWILQNWSNDIEKSKTKKT